MRKFFSNSVTVWTETGCFSFALGIIFGLILGQAPQPVPGLSEPVRLGLADGPLVVFNLKQSQLHGIVDEIQSATRQ